MTASVLATDRDALAFPDGFVWGAATSAHQIEGATDRDGRGPSIWDVFARTPGTVVGGATADTACDHYDRYRDDVALMRRLGLRAYRFSVAWPRVQPDGSGPANRAGLDFYDRLVDALLAADIAPYVTLYHWDLPQALEETGGWTDRATAHRFADYAALVHDRLGDRVPTWITINEPWVAAVMGYGMGVHAPGRRSAAAAARASHHLLLAHGLGTQALRAAGARQVALTLNLAPVLTPAQLTDPDAELSPADAAAVHRVDALLNRQFLDPTLRGDYPPEVLDVVERTAGLDHIHPDDLDLIHQPVDLLGVNYYNPCVVRSKPGEPANAAYPGSEDIEFSDAHGPTTAIGWPIVPAGFTRLLGRLSRDYPGVGLLVTENGAAFEDTIEGDRVPDTDRTDYLDSHLRAAHAAIRAGADLRGYLVWTLLDNFEWAEGFGPRFGIVHVDFATQQRLPKDSALWYRDVIRGNALPAAGPHRPTLEEVAARAGVSRSTVSRVINGDTASPRARDSVWDAVRQLGYVPNSAARTLVTRRTDAVALVVSDAGTEHGDDPVLATIVRTVARELERVGKHLVLMVPETGSDHRRARDYIGAGHVDGLILASMRGVDPLPGSPARPAVPTVSLGRLATRPAVPFVALDDRDGAARATRHLIDRGRRAIAMIAGPPELGAARERLAGYRDAVEGAGLRPRLVDGHLTRASGTTAMRRLLAEDPEVDAVFAANDLMAIGALRVLRAQGRRVPDDVAVVGFDDIEAASYAVPALTTVRGAMAEAAATAVREVVRRLDGHPATSTVLPTELVVRDST